MSNETQNRYSALTLEKMRAESVFEALFNHNYEGQPTAGAVKIPYRSEVSVSSYDVEDGADLGHAITNFKTLLIDKDKAVNELIDGYEAAAVPDSIIADRIDSAGYSLGYDIDTTLAALCKSGGTAMENTDASTKDTIYINMVNAVTQAKKAKVRKNEMWFVVSADAAEMLILSDDFIKATTGDIEAWGLGFVGRVAGVPVFESLNLPEDVEFVLGNRVYCNEVMEWAVPVAVNDLKDGSHIGASALQGRLVWGADITEATSVVVKTVTP